MSDAILKAMQVLESRVETFESKALGQAIRTRKLNSERKKDFNELANMMANGFTELKTDLNKQFNKEIEELKGFIDIKIDQTIGTVRKDYDSLASRVRDLENAAREAGFLPNPVEA